MRKALTVFALIAFACDFSRDVLVHSDPARKPEAAGRNDGYENQQEPRVQLDDAESPRGLAEDRERSSELVGKWRSNGEALEPKWRDGDSVPLLPFSHYRPYSRDAVDDAEQEENSQTRRPFKYRYPVNQPNRPRGSSSRRVVAPPDEHDELTHRTRDPVENYPRKRRRPLKNPSYEETLENADGKQRGDDQQQSDDKEATKYREAFQARPNEYEQEFNDEEHLRPRPRKRRPPQNYEFALANEAAASEEEPKSTSRPQAQLKENRDRPVTQSPDNKRSRNEQRRSENALELKSLLKMQQEEGSSLSEILQRRNLTLSDLLKGKADVINALKSRIADESDEYIEEMSRVMSNSLMKLAATVTPPWRSTIRTVPAVSAGTTLKSVATSSASDDSAPKVTIASDKISMSSQNEISNNTNPAKEIIAAEMTQPQFAHDSSWLKATTPPSISITTSTSPPAVNSMEYFLNDDGNVGLTNDRGTKLESLDEDEIMEFSDFTDFKKAKSRTAPAWPSSPSEPAGKPENPRDIGSTLSIEQILNPTERIEKDCTGDDQDDDSEDNDKSGETTQDNLQSISLGEFSAEDYNAFIETEYQSDAAMNAGEDDEKQNTVKANSDKSDASTTEKKQTAGDESRLHDKNHSTEYHQVDETGRRRQTHDRALENHRGATSTRPYEEVVSEIEPEARAEIFELFASGSAGKRLERLLKSRNMSLEELIALRQRGSSKVHLTEVSRLRVPKRKDPQTLDTVTSRITSTENGEIIISLSPTSSADQHPRESTERESARREAEKSMTRLKQDIISYLHDPLFDKDAENMSMSKLLELVERDRNASSGRTIPDNKTRDAEGHGELEDSHREVQIVDLLTTFDSLPFAKNVQFNTEVNNGNGLVPETKFPTDDDNASVVVINEEERTVRSNSSNEIRTGYVEEIVKEEPNAIDVRRIYGETISSTKDKNGREERKTPLSKVRPSIIASGAILGVTIVVFLAIFIVCRIRQKQKYTYRNTFSRAVFQGPVLAARKLSNSSSLSNVMVNVVATSTTKKSERTETQEVTEEFDGKSDMDNDSLDANDSWETIPDYAK